MAKKKPKRILNKPKTMMINAKDIIVPTKLLHAELTPEQDAFSRYTYKHAGHYLYGNYEQWENGFLRERDPDSELMIWMRIAAVMQQLKITDKDAAKKQIGHMCVGTPLPEAAKAWKEVEDRCSEFVEEAFREAGIAIEDGEA